MAVTTKKQFPATTNATTTVFSPVGIQLNNQDDLDVYVTLSGGTRVLQLRQATTSTAVGSGVNKHPQVNNTDGLYFPAISAGTNLINYTLSSDNNTITFNSALPSGAVVFCERRTRDADGTYTTFASGSTIRATDLNNSSTESNFTAQDARNKALDIENAIFNGVQPTINGVPQPFIDSSNIIDGSIGTADIADDAITNAKIGNLAVSGAEIANTTIDSTKLVNGAVTTDQLGTNAVTSVKIANNAVTNDKIADGTIATAKYQTGSVSGTVLANGAVTEPKIQDGSVTQHKLTTDAVSTIKIQNGAVTNAKLAPNAVAGSVVADNAVTTGKILNNAVTTDKIADVNVTRAKLANDAVNEDKLADLAVRTEHLAGDAVTTAKIADAELKTLAGMQSGTASKLADSTALTADIADLNQIDGMQKATTVTDDDTKFPTSGAVVDYVAAQLEPFGGFEAIANESSFPNTQPVSGVVISIADAGGMAVSNTGTASGATVGGTTVNISGIPSNFRGSNVAAGIRFLVVSTGSSQNYTYHKATLKEDDLVNLSGDINDFSERYRVGSSNPTTSLDSGDLFFNTGTGKLLVYNGTNSAWEEAQSVGNFFINTISSSSSTGGGSATANGTAYRFTLSNAGTTAQQHLVSVDGVIQKPNSGTSQPSEGFAVSGSDIIFGSAPVNGASIFVITIGSTVNIGTPSNNTVNSAILQNGSVTTAKIVDDAVSADKIGTLTGNVDFADNAKARFGTGNDLEVYHDGGGSIIKDVGTGDLRIGGDGDLLVMNAALDETKAKFSSNGAVELYYDNVKQLETKNPGINVNGHVHANLTGSQISSGDPTGGDYLMLYHDGSNGFIQNGSGGITIRDVSGGNIEIQATDGESSILCNHNGAVELYHDNSKKLETTSEGVLIGNGGLHLGDNNKIEIGNSDDLQIYHDGSGSYIDNTSSGNLELRSNEFRAKNLSGVKPFIQASNNGEVQLYYDGTKKFETTNTGATVSGSTFRVQTAGSSNVVVGSTNASGAYLVLDGDSNGDGAGGDYAYLEHGSDGNLAIHCDNPAGNSQFELYTGNGGTLSMLATSGGRVDLYYAGAKKLETQSYGAKVTGYLSQSAPVSWMAYATSQWYSINAGTSNDPFVFNNTAHNIGSHYHTSGTDAGKFVAPIDGVYQLNWNIFAQCPTNQTNAATLEMYVKINGNSISRLHNKIGYGNMGDDQQVMNLSVTEQLSAGDKVHIRLSAYIANWQVYGGHSTFSGHLVG